jgi:drug/metabolite transporter (DMT)-like permease
MRTALLVTIVVLAGTGGEIAATHAMRLCGEVKNFAPRVLLATLGRAFRQGWMWIGIAQMALSFFSLLALLSWEDVSFAIPVTALSYAVGALGARLFLGEQVSGARWAGVLLVCLGVALVSAS